MTTDSIHAGAESASLRAAALPTADPPPGGVAAPVPNRVPTAFQPRSRWHTPVPEAQRILSVRLGVVCDFSRCSVVLSDGRTRRRVERISPMTPEIERICAQSIQLSARLSSQSQTGRKAARMRFERHPSSWRIVVGYARNPTNARRFATSATTDATDT